MEFKRYIAPLALLSLLASTSALAMQPGKVYVGAQYSGLTYSDTYSPDFNPSALILRGGYNFNKYFSVEGRYGTGLADDTQTNSWGDIGKMKLDNMYGVYALGHIPLSKGFDLYGVAGYSNIKLSEDVTASGSTVTNSYSDSESDLSIGAGAEYSLQSVSFSLEYMSYISKSVYDINAIALGANYHF